MSIFEMRQGTVAVSDPSIAAALLSNAVFWGNSPEQREIGPTSQHHYKPAMFNTVECYRNKRTGGVRVLFVIGGDPVDLKHRRFLFNNGCLYVNGNDFRKQRTKLMAIIAEKRKLAKHGNLKDAKSISVTEKTIITGRELLGTPGKE